MAGKSRQNGERNENGGGKAPKQQQRSNRYNPLSNSNAREPNGDGEWTEVNRRESRSRPKNNDKNGNPQRTNTAAGQQNQSKNGNVNRKPEAAREPADECKKLRDYCVVYTDQSLATEGKKYWKFS